MSRKQRSISSGSTISQPRKELCQLSQEQIEEVQTINDRLMPLHEALFCESNPGPVKYGASLLDKCAAEVRLPLCEIAETSKERVQTAMRSAGSPGDAGSWTCSAPTAVSRLPA